MLCFITYLIVLISVQDDGAVDVLRRMNYRYDQRGSLANGIPSRTIEQANQEFRQHDRHSQNASNT